MDIFAKGVNKLRSNEGQDLVGLSKEAAIARLKAKNARFRIICEEGRSMIVTSDCNPNRFNLTIVGGHVYNVTMG